MYGEDLGMNPDRNIETMQDLFMHELRTMYYVENQLVEALDEMAEMATNDRVSTAFADHRDETEEHVERLERVFEELGAQPEQETSHVLDGLIEERQMADSAIMNEDLRNMFYLGAGMKTERIEVTSYESMLLMADKMNMEDDIVEPLEENLDDEKDALSQLNTLSTGSKLKSLFDKLTDL